MDCQGRWMNRASSIGFGGPWYEQVYLSECQTSTKARAGIGWWLDSLGLAHDAKPKKAQPVLSLVRCCGLATAILFVTLTSSDPSIDDRQK